MAVKEKHEHEIMIEKECITERKQMREGNGP